MISLVSEGDTPQSEPKARDNIDAPEPEAQGTIGEPIHEVSLIDNIHNSDAQTPALPG